METSRLRADIESDRSLMLRRFGQEIQRQIESRKQAAATESNPARGGSSELSKKRGKDDEYLVKLIEFKRHFHSYVDMDILAVDPPPMDYDFAMNIASHCEPKEELIDSTRNITQKLKLIINRPSYSSDPSIPVGHDFWQQPPLLNWATSEKTEFILFGMSGAANNCMEHAAASLAQHLIHKKRKVACLFHDFSKSPRNTCFFLKQITFQVLKANNHSFRTWARTAEVIDSIVSAKSEEHWIRILEAALIGMSVVFILVEIRAVIPMDMAARADGSAKTFIAWQKFFETLVQSLGKSSPSTILKVLFLGSSQGTEMAGIPTISSRTGAQQQNNVQWALSDFRGQRFLKSSRPAKVDLPLLEDEVVREKSETPDHAKALAHSSEDGQKGIAHTPSNRKDHDDDVPSEIGSVAGKGRLLKDWFREMKSFEKCVDAARREPDILHPRIKIAIFDTGLDLTHPDIDNANQDGRIKVHDFIEESSKITDLDGHGTHCTSLLLKYAPNAEIYAGRIFRRSRADSTSTVTLTKAISHAVDTWEVDIITLSLGFTESDDDLRDAILKASADYKLIFAAAANNTTNEQTPIRFPARLAEVICVFSSDSHGRPSAFNPPPRYNHPNFTFPGEQIEGAWPTSVSAEGAFRRGDNNALYKYQDGTSCSTPIAAAVAAGILEYAWQERAHTIRKRKLLKHYRGMTSVFIKWMLDRHKIGGNDFHYVKPWMLMSESAPQNEIPILISRTMDDIDA